MAPISNYETGHHNYSIRVVSPNHELASSKLLHLHYYGIPGLVLHLHRCMFNGGLYRFIHVNLTTSEPRVPDDTCCNDDTTMLEYLSAS